MRMRMEILAPRALIPGIHEFPVRCKHRTIRGVLWNMARIGGQGQVPADTVSFHGLNAPLAIHAGNHKENAQCPLG